MGNVILKQDFTEAIYHGIYVSNMAYELGKELGLPKEELKELVQAGMLHDIGKLQIANEEDVSSHENMVIEQLRYVKMHPTLSYEILKAKGYSDYILESVLYHHENYDGSGYPANLQGEDIPYGARILRVCDVFIALTSDRAYREKFDVLTAISMMTEEVKNYDMKVFLAFMNVVNSIDIDIDIKNRNVKKCDKTK